MSNFNPADLEHGPKKTQKTQKTERSIPKNNQAENMKVAKNTKTTMNTQNPRILRKQGYKESTRTQRQSGSWESVGHDCR